MKYIKILRNKFKKYNIDGYVIPKNDEYFTEYSKINRLEVISNFSGSAGLAVILKSKNYLFYPSAKNRRDLKIKTSGA